MARCSGIYCFALGILVAVSARSQAVPLYIAIAYPNTTLVTLPIYRLHLIADVAFGEVQQWKAQGKLSGLDGYELVPLHVSTYPLPVVDANPHTGVAVMRVVKTLLQNRAVALAGEVQSTIPIAEVATLYNLPMINTLIYAPELYNRAVFPNMVNLGASPVVFTKPLLQLLDTFRWTRVAIIKQTRNPYLAAANDLEKHLRAAGHTVLISDIFHPEKAEDTVDRVMLSDARVIFAFVRPGNATTLLMCEVYRHNLYGENHIWFVQNFQDESYRDTVKVNPSKCTSREILRSLNHTLRIKLQEFTGNTLTGKSSFDIASGKYAIAFHNLYDGVWAAALTLNKTVPILGQQKMEAILQDASYKRKDLTELFLKTIHEIEFDGSNGRFKLSGTGIRINSAALTKIVDGERIEVATYSYDTFKFTWTAIDSYLWEGHGGKPPPDRHKESHIKLNKVLIYGTWAMAGLSTFVATLYMFAVLMDPSERTRILSCVTAFGAILINGTSVLQGIDIEESNLKYVCQTRAWMQLLAFSLFYGAMTFKTLAIYKSFSQTKQHVNECAYMAWLVLLLLIDLTLLVPWQIWDPLTARDITIPSQDRHKRASFVSVCVSSYVTYWMVGLHLINGSLAVLGLFITWPAWIVSHKYGSTDVVYVGISMYIVVGLNAIGIPVSYLVPFSSRTLRYAFDAGCRLLSVLLTVIILLVVKVYSVRKGGTEEVLKVLSPLRGIFGFVSMFDGKEE